MIKTSVIDPALALRIVREDPNVIAYDTETTGLTVRDIACGYVVTNNEYSIYVPVRHEAGGNIPNGEQFEKEMADSFADRHRSGFRTVGHHMGFDLRVSLRHGIIIRGCEDTMINESLIDDTTVGYGLDDCAERRGVTAKKGDAMYRAIAERFGGLPDKKQMGSFWRMPGDHAVVLDYATGDGVSTLELWAAQQPILDELGLRRVWQLECDLLPYLARIHNRGLKIDANYADQCDIDLKKSIEAAKSKFPAGFNVRSTGELESLFRAKGYGDDDFARTAPTQRHPKGQISFREKWLEKNVIGKDVLSVRRLEKAKDSFITPLVATHNVDGRVHPVLHQSKTDEFGVAGARLSCSDPNLQAYPKRNKDVGKVVRPLVSADDGMVIEEADAMQQEPRFFTHYSEDPALIDGYRSGDLDIHDRASAVLNLDRDYAKRLGLGMLTMMSPPTLAMHMDYSLAEAQRDHRAFLYDAFPMIREMQQSVKSVYAKRGYIKTLMGRRAWCRDPRFAYQGVSRLIQNNGGDHIKLCILRACQFEDAHPNIIQLLLSIHDSLMWQRDPAAVKELKELVAIIENVANEMGVIVPIPFEVGSGSNWAEASYGGKLKGKKGWLV